jgi:hypothetical protein
MSIWFSAVMVMGGFCLAARLTISSLNASTRAKGWKGTSMHERPPVSSQMLTVYRCMFGALCGGGEVPRSMCCVCVCVWYVMCEGEGECGFCVVLSKKSSEARRTRCQGQRLQAASVRVEEGATEGDLWRNFHVIPPPCFIQCCLQQVHWLVTYLVLHGSNCYSHAASGTATPSWWLKHHCLQRNGWH